MSEAYIVDAVRTPVGKRNGGLSKAHPADLGAHVIKALLERAKVDPRASTTSSSAASTPIGPQAGDIARTCWLAAGLPDEVPGTTVDRQCGSSQQAVHFAAQAVMSGTQDLVVAGGVQNMSMIPIARGDDARRSRSASSHPFSGSKGWQARYGTQDVSQFRARRDDRRQVGHHPRGHGGVRAREPPARDPARSTKGASTREIAPYGEVATDEGPRARRRSRRWRR